MTKKGPKLYPISSELCFSYECEMWARRGGTWASQYVPQMWWTGQETKKAPEPSLVALLHSSETEGVQKTLHLVPLPSWLYKCISKNKI